MKKYLPLIVFLGITIRIIMPLNDVFNNGYINFLGPDSYYHAIHLKEILRTFPSMPDIYIQDWFIVAFAWIVSLGKPTMKLVEIISLFTSPLTAGCTILLVYFISLKLFGGISTLIASAYVAFIPGEFLFRTLLGNIDHHAAEVLVTTALMTTILYAYYCKHKGLKISAIFIILLLLVAYAYVWPGARSFLTLNIQMASATYQTTQETASIASLIPYHILNLIMAFTCLAILILKHRNWLLIGWLFLTATLTCWQIRFDYYLIVPVSVAAGGIMGKDIHISERLRDWAIIALAVVTLHGFIIYGAIISSDNQAPSKEWNQAADWIKENTPKESIITSWWDYGYFVEYRAERRAYIDPGQNAKKIRKVAECLMSYGDPELPGDYFIADEKTSSNYYQVMSVWAGTNYGALNMERTFLFRLYNGKTNLKIAYDNDVRIWILDKM